MARTQPIGIDLGTTYSAVACLDSGGRTKMVPNVEGETLTPSVVLFEDDQTIVGKAARKAGILKVGRLAECVKRDMGQAFYSRTIRGEQLPPETIQACILRQLKRDIVRTVGPDAAAVITVPAFFDETRRTATADAGEIAGLNLLDIVNEPTAAALAFGEELGYLTSTGDLREPLTVLVYDLGGGTFDVTVIQLKPGDFRTVATDGDVHLGGRDWDLRLASYVADAFIKEHDADPRHNPTSWQRLLGEIEEAKRTLTARQQTSVRVDHGGHALSVPLTREVFEEATADLLERTAYTTRQVLRAAAIDWADVDHVLLVGGSSRMPMVARMIERLSGKTPERSVNPDEAVARGAAIYAGYLLSKRDTAAAPPFDVTDVNSHSLGIEGVDPQTGRRRNAILIPRNTPLPASKTREFVTRAANQRSIALHILEGESAAPEECSAIGRTVIDDLPPALPQGWPIQVTYQYGANGRLSVRGLVPGTDREVSLEIERERGMTGPRVAQWKLAVAEDAGLDPFEALIAEELRNQQQPTRQPRQSDKTSVAPAAEGPSATNNSAAGDDRDLAANDSYASPGLIESPMSPAAEVRADEVPSMQSAGNLGVRRRSHGVLAYLAGHLIFSVLGLVVGYYVLCWIAPDANFLHLRLPGLHP